MLKEKEEHTGLVFFFSSFSFHSGLYERVHANDFGTCVHFSKSPNTCYKSLPYLRGLGGSVTVGYKMLRVSALIFAVTLHIAGRPELNVT